MKIRIKGDSLRYRLTKSDVNTLATEGSLQESTSFGANVLIYAIKITDTNLLEATFIGNEITLFMSQHMISEFTGTNKVGFENKSGSLSLLVEKDFTCLDNVEEDQSDNFPNPLLANKI
jgi:hypothetical protein